MGKRGKRVSTDGGGALGSNPFGELESTIWASSEGIRARPSGAVEGKVKPISGKKSRGRVDVIRQRSSGGGGWMTVATNFVGISNEEKKELKKRVQKRCGVGGTLKAGSIEIQGDKREEVRAVLEEAGFSVVFAGG